MEREGHVSSDEELFREFEHTGDIGIELSAASRIALFAHAVTALARLMVEPDAIRASERREIVVNADGDDDLMHDLLAAALNVFLADGFIWRDAEVDERDHQLAARLLGEQFDGKRHRLLTEIKAVTYHQLAVEHAGDRWRARIIFDV